MIRPRYVAAFLAATVPLCAGCVERKLIIGSDPSGAIVTLNDQEVGRTPVTVPFTWYGDYDIRLRLDRNVGTPDRPEIRRYYLHTNKQTQIPWFEVFGMDLIAELLPIQFKDEQVWAFPVPEVKEPTTQALIQRAEELKSQMSTPEELRNQRK